MNEMTCREFDEVVHGYVRMELLDVHLREAALEHTAHCVNCANRMAEAVVLAEASEVGARQALGQHSPARVEAAVLAAFRAHHRRTSLRRTLEWSMAGAVAAVLLIFLWAFGSRSNGPLQPGNRNEGSSQSNTVQDARNTVSPTLNDAGNDAGNHIEEHAKNVADVAVEASYIASDFLPVPFTGGIAPEDSGMVVRVQMTRASLAQLGYPVAAASGDDLISADVLVDEDGWPRGVKLVQ
jgi:hypothetical protein